MAGVSLKISQVTADPSFGELQRAGGLGALQRLATSPWVWPPLFIATALLQLLLISTRPASWWARRRHSWMLANRGLVAVYLLTTLAAGAVGAVHDALWRLLLQHARSLAQRSGPVAAAFSLLSTWTGVLTMLVHNAAAWLPVRWTPVLQLPTTLAIVHAVLAAPLSELLRDPAILPGYTKVCGVLVGVVGELTGASTLGPHNAELCKSIHPLPVMVFWMVGFGYVANLGLLVLWERALKHTFAKSVAPAATAQANADRIGSGSDGCVGYVVRPATTSSMDEDTRAVDGTCPPDPRGTPPQK